MGALRIEGKYATHSHAMQRERRYFFASLVMLAILVVISLFVPSPTEWQMTILRLVMALSAAAFVAYLPGMLTIQGTIPNTSFLNNAKLRATGAFAIFVLVYYYAPKIIRK